LLGKGVAPDHNQNATNETEERFHV